MRWIERRVTFYQQDATVSRCYWRPSSTGSLIVIVEESRHYPRLTSPSFARLMRLYRAHNPPHRLSSYSALHGDSYWFNDRPEVEA